MAPTIPAVHEVAAHIEQSLAAAPLREEPFPHAVVDRLLPEDFYDSLIGALPPPACFTGDYIKPNWRFTAEGVPADSYRLWKFLADDVIPEILVPLIARRFAAHLRAGALAHSDVRMLLRRPGYNIRPHLDPDRSSVTTLLYLARPGDPEAYGTELHRTDRPVPGAQPRTYYPDETVARHEPAVTVPFRRNTALIFANVGLHSASIPKTAPADLDRYAVQFYLGPAAQPSQVV